MLTNRHRHTAHQELIVLVNGTDETWQRWRRGYWKQPCTGEWKVGYRKHVNNLGEQKETGTGGNTAEEEGQGDTVASGEPGGRNHT